MQKVQSKYMNGNELRIALHEGRRVYGTLVVSPSPRWTQAVNVLGLDFVFLDTEHVAMDRAQLSWMCETYSAMRLAPVVRIPQPDPYQACMVLDGGAQGIIVPYVETAEQVRQLVGACKYRPLKGIRLHRFLHGEERLEPKLQRYLDINNANNTLIVNIESLPALEALDDILSVEGLDGVLIGPHDLSISLGIPEEYDHPDFIHTVDIIIQKARFYHVGAGIHATFAGAVEQEIRWAKLGANLIVHWGDILTFRHWMRKDIEAIKLALGDLDDKQDSDAIHI